ncbi:hypothetical protein Rsub_03282 [Raphidocelis subcapitata]|uniref:Uncharacterized protein n=1 Tax=Raphidocelis subcapitata TaxID=307507 RepID=A0A2V0NS46_9CHLO|nr:hypothetical protein Rsub_03282 [Raphidocelis subcapitata]|eukprot:GBF90149.1 hypothetical protein Rsub_03282 [Raphidocelis subcapitata]
MPSPRTPCPLPAAPPPGHTVFSPLGMTPIPTMPPALEFLTPSKQPRTASYRAGRAVLPPSRTAPRRRRRQLARLFPGTGPDSCVFSPMEAIRMEILETAGAGAAAAVGSGARRVCGPAALPSPGPLPCSDSEALRRRPAFLGRALAGGGGPRLGRLFAPAPYASCLRVRLPACATKPAHAETGPRPPKSPRAPRAGCPRNALPLARGPAPPHPGGRSHALERARRSRAPLHPTQAHSFGPKSTRTRKVPEPCCGGARARAPLPLFSTGGRAPPAARRDLYPDKGTDTPPLDTLFAGHRSTLIRPMLVVAPFPLPHTPTRHTPTPPARAPPPKPGARPPARPPARKGGRVRGRGARC